MHVNDRSRQGPGQGSERFAPVLRALRRNGYTGPLSVEPSIYVPDEAGLAARAIGYLRGVLETIETA